MTEKEIVKELRKYWKQNGWYIIRNQLKGFDNE